MSDVYLYICILPSELCPHVAGPWDAAHISGRTDSPLVATHCAPCPYFIHAGPWDAARVASALGSWSGRTWNVQVSF